MTPAGRAAPAAAAGGGRRRPPFPAPGNSPSYQAYGPTAAGSATALFGVQALLLLDPALNHYGAGAVDAGRDTAAGRSRSRRPTPHLPGR
ncbi:hypothetical protein [Nocardia testacea]|uniref:hypothetical protein n=1 Tax=Nocardia testacea TaxID=248551 RepID=UPI003A8B6BCB